MSGKAYWVDRAKTLEKALEHLVGVIEAHDLESLSCDRDGRYFCECLDEAVKKSKQVLTNSENGV